MYNFFFLNTLKTLSLRKRSIDTSTDLDHYQWKRFLAAGGCSRWLLNGFKNIRYLRSELIILYLHLSKGNIARCDVSFRCNPKNDTVRVSVVCPRIFRVLKTKWGCKENCICFSTVVPSTGIGSATTAVATQSKRRE